MDLDQLKSNLDGNPDLAAGKCCLGKIKFTHLDLVLEGHLWADIESESDLLK